MTDDERSARLKAIESIIEENREFLIYVGSERRERRWRPGSRTVENPCARATFFEFR